MNQISDEKKNIHIPYEQSSQPYHYVLANIVKKYAGERANILDVGTGVGHTVALIREQMPDVTITAVDIDAQCLKIAQTKALINYTVQINDLGDLKNLGAKYDVIIMSHVLEHLMQPVDALRMVMNLMSKNGVLILAVPNLVTPAIIFSSLRREHYVNRGHVCSWDRSHWMNFLENIVQVNVLEYSQDYVPFPVFWKIRRLRSLFIFLAKLFPWFSFSNIAVIQKKT